MRRPFQYGYFFGAILSITGCSFSPQALDVQRQIVTADYFASNRVGTKDTMRFSPTIGENLIVSWNCSDEEWNLDPQLALIVRLQDQEEKIQIHPLKRQRGAHIFFFPCFELGRQILCYKVVLIDRIGRELREEQSRLWVEKIGE
ncbi:MAG: hypothetical protein AAGF04_01380 [Chlamydiota bacterium]